MLSQSSQVSEEVIKEKGSLKCSVISTHCEESTWGWNPWEGVARTPDTCLWWSECEGP